MSRKSGLLSICTIALSFAFTVSTWAATTVCTTRSYDDGTGATLQTAKIAVASNFYTPAQTMVDNLQASYGGNTAITICHNSTTHLLAEINNGTELPSVFSSDPGFPRYDYFFAANASSPTSLYNNGTTKTVSYAPFSYVKGIPVMFGLKTVLGQSATYSDLITGATSNTISADTTTTPAISTYSVNTSTAGLVALASTAAPYGVASHSILNAMDGTSLPGTIPSWVYSTLFSNIDLTYSAVEVPGSTGIKSGFVGKSQICNEITAGTVAYVQFTSSAYTLDQKAIQLTSNALATALDTYLDNTIGTTTWSTFCSNNCYYTP